MDRTEQLINTYALAPHAEGGWFRESYTAPVEDGARSIAGSIYFLLCGEEVSHLHRIDCEEVWYYHEGGGLKITMIGPAGDVSCVLLGPDATRGQRHMAVVPAGTVFGSENIDKGSYTFVSCMTAPKFRYEGFSLVERAELLRLCPDADETLRALAAQAQK